MIDYLEDVKKMLTRQFEFDEEDLDEEANLETDLNIAELDLEDFVAELEKKYEITIPQEAYIQFKKVSDIADYLDEHVDQD